MINWRSIFVRYRILVAAAVVLGLLGGVAYCWLRPSEYVATTRLFFSTGAVDVSEVYQGTLAGQERVRTYAELAGESKVINGAIAASGVSSSEETVRDRMKVDVPPGTVLIDVSVTSQDVPAAVKLSGALADQLVALVSQLETPLGGGPPPVAMTVVASSVGSPALKDMFKPQYIGIGAGIGLLIGLLGALGLEMSSRKRRARASASLRPDDRADTESIEV